MPRLAFAGVLLLAVIAIGAPAPARGDELLSNGGFESGVSPWTTTFGQLDAVSSPVRSGARAARLASSALQSHEIYRSVAVSPGQAYEMSGWLLLNDSNLDRAFLRVSWFDAGGGLVSQADSPWLTISASDYQPLTTGPITSPLAATSARVGVRAQASGPFNLHLDDFSFSGAIPSPPTAPPSPVSTATPAATATPAPSTRTPSATAKPSATPGLPGEPGVFDVLTNGGFEIPRVDGTPYAWKDFGADLQVSKAAKTEGAQSLALWSRTSSTKWAYQTVRVQPGAFYDASGYTWNAGAEETFLRVSWYASTDGSGAALDSSDSTGAALPGDRFQLLTTGPIPAPGDAQTARVRLMMRPGTDAVTAAYFDAVAFAVTDARLAPQSGTSTPGRLAAMGSGRGDASSTAGEGAATVPLVERSRLGFANVKPAPTAAPATVAPSGSGYEWLAVLGIVIGAAAIAFTVITERSRRRSDEGSNR